MPIVCVSKIAIMETFAPIIFFFLASLWTVPFGIG